MSDYPRTFGNSLPKWAFDLRWHILKWVWYFQWCAFKHQRLRQGSIANGFDNAIDDMIDQELIFLSHVAQLRDFIDRIRKLAGLREDQ